MQNKKNQLLTRDEFREGVFARDNHKCVVCKQPGQDAHHIMERRLFRDGGYYLDNGATLCGECHLRAESNGLFPHEIRQYAGIAEVVLPDHLYRDVVYDKWANIVIDVHDRIISPGELFDDPSVQKILSGSVTTDRVAEYVKYPRTSHLPDSPGMTDDDRVIPDMSLLRGEEIIVTAKMDGENTTMYRDFIHARSLSGLNHPSQTWIKQFWAQHCGDIPEGYRVCGENLYATHSIKYTNLPAYFLMFSMWKGTTCLSWDETVDWAQLFGFHTVQVLYRGTWNSTWENYKKALDLPRSCCEGYVVRVAREFTMKEFPIATAKYVRAQHVQTSHNWRNRWNGETNVVSDVVDNPCA